MKRELVWAPWEVRKALLLRLGYGRNSASWFFHEHQLDKNYLRNKYRLP